MAPRPHPTANPTHFKLTATNTIDSKLTAANPFTATRLTATQLNVLAQSLLNRCMADGNLNFDGHHKTTRELDNEADARRLADRIRRMLGECRPYEALDLLETYDLLHRIGHGRLPSSVYMTAQRERIIEAWRKGDPLLPEPRIRRLLAKN